MLIITKDTYLAAKNCEFFMPIGDVNIHMKLEVPESAGEKLPLLILIHGFTGHMEERHIIGVKDTALSEGFACLRMDMYGHGKSEGKFCDHDLQKWLDEAVAVMDYAKTLDWVEKIAISGHSQGGLLVTLAAGERPDDLAFLMPLSPAYIICEGARQGICLGLKCDPDNLPERVDMFGDLYLTRNYFAVSQKFFPEKAMEAYAGPTLIVHGNADETIPVEGSRDAIGHYKAGKLIEIPGDTHCFDNHLDQMLAAVKKFLKEMR